MAYYKTTFMFDVFYRSSFTLLVSHLPRAIANDGKSGGYNHAHYHISNGGGDTAHVLI